MMTLLWLLLGLLGGWGFVAYACQFTEAGRLKVWAQGLVIAALIYVVFALAGGHWGWVLYELIAVVVCFVFVYLGLNHSIYWLSIGWGIHPIWDIYVHLIGPASHVAPSWYAVLCLSFDVFVATHIIRYQISTSKQPESLNH